MQKVSWRLQGVFVLAQVGIATGRSVLGSGLACQSFNTAPLPRDYKEADALVFVPCERNVMMTCRFLNEIQNEFVNRPSC